MKGTSALSAKIFINPFAMAAEIERDLISQRTKNGLARVKAEERKLGNSTCDIRVVVSIDVEVSTGFENAIKFTDSTARIKNPVDSICKKNPIKT